MATIPRPPGLTESPPEPKLSTPAYIHVPRLIDAKTVGKINDALKAGEDIVIVHPKSRTPGGRSELRDDLRDAGVPGGAMAAFGWSTVDPSEPPAKLGVRPKPEAEVAPSPIV